MKTKLISTIIGLVLIVGVGSAVYINKKPQVLPIENTEVQTSTTVKTTTQTPTNNYESEDDDDESGSIVPNPVVTPKPVTTTPAPTTTPSGITLTTVAKHNGSASCWSAINGNVYDLTSWIPNHPGGSQTILSLCGIDGSNGYNGQHGGSGKPARILAGFKLGALAK